MVQSSQPRGSSPEHTAPRHAAPCRAWQAFHGQSHCDTNDVNISWVYVIIVVASGSISSRQTRCLNRKAQPSCVEIGDFQRQLPRGVPVSLPLLVVPQGSFSALRMSGKRQK